MLDYRELLEVLILLVKIFFIIQHISSDRLYFFLFALVKRYSNLNIFGPKEVIKMWST